MQSYKHLKIKVIDKHYMNTIDMEKTYRNKKIKNYTSLSQIIITNYIISTGIVIDHKAFCSLKLYIDCIKDKGGGPS